MLSTEGTGLRSCVRTVARSSYATSRVSNCPVSKRQNHLSSDSSFHYTKTTYFERRSCFIAVITTQTTSQPGWILHSTTTIDNNNRGTYGIHDSTRHHHHHHHQWEYLPFWGSWILLYLFLCISPCFIHGMILLEICRSHNQTSLYQSKTTWIHYSGAYGPHSGTVISPPHIMTECTYCRGTSPEGARVRTGHT
jgi:hypothetical protein